MFGDAEQRGGEASLWFGLRASRVGCSTLEGGWIVPFHQ
jgi:hypothetical protein